MITSLTLTEWIKKITAYQKEVQEIYEEWKNSMEKILSKSEGNEPKAAFEYYCQEIIEKKILETLKKSKKFAQCILDLESEERDKWLEADRTISWACYPKKTVSDNIEKRFRREEDEETKFPKSMREVSENLQTSVNLSSLYSSYGEDEWKVKIIKKKEKFQELFDEYKVEPLSISEAVSEDNKSVKEKKKDYQDLIAHDMRIEYGYLLQRKIGELFFLPFPHEAEGWEKEMLLTMEEWDEKLKWLARNKNHLFINEKYKINLYNGLQFNFLAVGNIILYNYAYQKNNEWIKVRAEKAVDLIFSSIDKEETINQHSKAAEKLEKKRAEKKELLVKSITFFWQNYFFERVKYQGALTLNDESFGGWNSISKLPVCCYSLRKEEEDYVDEDELAVKGYRKIAVFPAFFAVDNNGKRIAVNQVFTLFLKSRIPNSKSFAYWVDKYVEELCLTDQDKEKKEQLKKINRDGEWLVFHASSWQRNFSFVSLTDENSQYLGPVLVYEGEKEGEKKHFLSFKKYKNTKKEEIISINETIDNLDNVSEKQKSSLNFFFSTIKDSHREKKITESAIEIGEYVDYLNYQIIDHEEKIVNYKAAEEETIEEIGENKQIFKRYRVIYRKRYEENFVKNRFLNYHEESYIKFSPETYFIQNETLVNLITACIIEKWPDEKKIPEELKIEGVKYLNFIGGSGGRYARKVEEGEGRLRDWTVFPFLGFEENWVAINKGILGNHHETDTFSLNMVEVYSALSKDPLTIQDLKIEKDGYYYREKGDSAPWLRLDNEEMEFADIINKKIVRKAKTVEELLNELKEPDSPPEKEKKNLDTEYSRLVKPAENKWKNSQTSDSLPIEKLREISKKFEKLNSEFPNGKEKGWQKLFRVKLKKKIEKFVEWEKEIKPDKPDDEEASEEKEPQPESNEEEKPAEQENKHSKKSSSEHENSLKQIGWVLILVVVIIAVISILFRYLLVKIKKNKDLIS